MRIFTPSDTGYALINNSPVGTPANPAPAVPMSVALVDRVTYGRGGLSGHTNEWGSWLDETDAISRTTTYQRDGANNLTHETNPTAPASAPPTTGIGNLLTRMELDAGQWPGVGVNVQGPTWAYTPRAALQPDQDRDRSVGPHDKIRL
ncbi:hypothetical protein [Candidatus Amarolinea dominans]|uniref:hypothetical protein n=1 Tax=Candidatus Amarolinea dominans TaxID=3140696 RepID=UPI001DB2F2D8|nr:hypothetical protein [Anaerolineae bacterium]